MATDQATPTVNGNFIPTQQSPYEPSPQTNGAHSSTNSITATISEYTSASTEQQSVKELSKDEIGWFFVERYYTTMSKSPEKLYLFYTKRSQFLSGIEAEQSPVCVGQKAINERIQELEIEDCKIRVTNVDSQSSGQNIVIQVIGEIWTKKLPQRKFAQTFVLAEQTNGYFVLNDIFRYLVDDDEEDPEGEALQQPQKETSTGYQEPTSTVVPEAEPHTLTNSHDPAEREQQAQLVDQGLEEAAQDGQVNTAAEAPTAGAVNGEPSALPEKIQPAEDTAAAATAAADDENAADTHSTIEAVAHEDIKQQEKPAAPEPTPAASPPKQKAAQPVAVPAPIVPKTWATMAAAANRSNVPPTLAQNQPQTQVPAPTASKPTPTAQPQVTAPATNMTQDADQPATPQSSGSEWQTAARDHGKKQQRPQSGAANTPPDNSRAYMKNIPESITTDMIRDKLSQYGELTYCDINRQKQCAFADFATPAAYQAAVSANPHEINGERVIVEERRIRPQNFAPYPGGQRGGMGPRGRGNMPRDGGRGNFGNRGRGAPRGRGGVSQAA